MSATRAPWWPISPRESGSLHTHDGRGRWRPRSSRQARALGRHLNAYIDDRLYVEELDRWARRYAEYAEVGVNLVDDLAAAVERAPRRRSSS